MSLTADVAKRIAGSYDLLGVRHLKLIGKGLKDCSILKECHNIVSLDLSSNKITDCSFLSHSHHSSLSTFTINNCKELKSISALEKLPKLMRLSITNCPSTISFEDLVSVISSLPVLVSLDISDSIHFLETPNYRDILISACPQLRTLCGDRVRTMSGHSIEKLPDVSEMDGYEGKEGSEAKPILTADEIDEMVAKSKKWPSVPVTRARSDRGYLADVFIGRDNLIEKKLNKLEKVKRESDYEK
ncbi:hypothetical protein ADUPG1_008591 [Aduncisulcus paluster]|uniref:Uncharacterized protein n=1 Tax=Aduncisulcus paluster TaxID=2918883 RepID=A0ABQ5KVH0_9EUKA|nr:hypothetical protein ADUPG1_008591 [Aduncisulcus paluster]|eukprot:gnl/Carplike_NY0171/5741_a7873_266.p1 GENE.gnl/Carplike_NY0171/5741_a7873_266~~gnl/Carplike_NY0171/5741_a7873_266.p1  ORF type:complete len:244 (-),score=26.03 gnl/Carplike_NY0171/5741_a7873_266:47-778(-)